jgi:hypothetical protein
MSTIKGTAKGAGNAAFMAEFKPLRGLWEGNNAAYPSEYSARWEVRKLRDELARSQAMAMHRGRLLYHPARFEAVAQKAAIEQFANRALGGAHD